VLHELPTLHLNHHEKANPADHARLLYVPLLRLLAPLQRAHRNTVQFPGISHRCGSTGCPMAAPVHVESADLAELFLERGLVFSHETVREWEARFAPFIAEQLRARRHGHAGTCWHSDETSIKVHGTWCYLYRAIDHDGNLVDSLLSEKRNREAAQRFFKQAVAVVGHTPESVTTAGHRSYPRAIRETMGNHVQHRTNKYLNNRLEQDHRGIKQRYYPLARL
jgi:transposase-like protein